MKRLFTLLLAVLYTLSSIGMTVSTHYCAGKQMKCKCAKSKKATKKDHCCKDTVQYLKSQDNHNSTNVEAVKKIQITEFPSVSVYSTITEPIVIASSVLNTVAIKLTDGPPLYELFCNYRI